LSFSDAIIRILLKPIVLLFFAVVRDGDVQLEGNYAPTLSLNSLAGKKEESASVFSDIMCEEIDTLFICYPF
jgi:hypothetical protein